MTAEHARPPSYLSFERPLEMGAADEVAQVLPARLVLRIERQVIDRAVRTAGNAEQRADDRLHTFGLARGGERGRSV